MHIIHHLEAGNGQPGSPSLKVKQQEQKKTRALRAALKAEARRLGRRLLVSLRLSASYQSMYLV
jgi:hypothetical protein